MSCTHVPDCPLFPKLNASLRGWRDAYCDSDSAWRSCARFQLSQTGKAVPLALLPNGRMAHTVTRSRPTEPSPSRFRTAAPLVVAGGGAPFEREPDLPDLPPPSPPRSGGTRVVARPPRTAPVARTHPRAGRWARLVAWMRGAV